ncbi:MAG: DUF433 domain-containing protein [Planctomycetes bacterium]|nr:DUF433 domain-containing protein [Planctomycetota bacterium]
MLGKPVIRGTRVTVGILLEHLASGWTLEEVLRNHPRLLRDDVYAALAFARSVVARESRRRRTRSTG